MLHPAFAVAGLLLIAVPIVIHLLNRRRFKTVQWAAMDFLLMAMRRNRRRLRFESWLLLATRCALLALAGLALARPIGCADNALAGVAGREGGLSVFIIDDSASMAYRQARDDSPTHLDHAKKLAARLIGRLGDGSEQVAVIAASSPAKGVIAAPTFDLPAAASAIGALPQTMRGTDLAGALDRATQIAAEVPATMRKTLYVLTDDTAGGLPRGEQLATAARAAAGQYKIVWHNLSAPGQSNAAVLGVGSTDPLIRRGFDARFAATLERFGGTATAANLVWRVDGGPVGVPADPQLTGEPKPLVNADPDLQNALADGRPHVLSAELSPPDKLPQDDARRRVVEQVRGLATLVVEGQRGGDAGTLGGSGAFLALALNPTRDGADGGYVDVTTISDLELAGRPLGEYRAVILAGVGNLAEPTAQALSDFVKSGGVLMLWAGEATTAENYNNVLLPRGLLPGPLVQRVQPPNDGLVGFDFDPDNPPPYLNAFRGLQRSGLDVPAIRQYWRVDLAPDKAADVVLRYLPLAGEDKGDPAVVTFPLGDGRVLMVTTAAGDPEWTLLPLKDNYAAFVHELLSHAVGNAGGGGGTAWETLDAGGRLTVPANLTAESNAAPPALETPAGESLPLSRQIRPDGTAVWRSDALEAVGVYSLKRGDKSWPVVVNVPAAESDLRPLDESAARSLLGDVDLTMLGDDLPPEVGSADEARADFGWTLLLIVLGLAAFECVLAMRFGKQRR